MSDAGEFFPQLKEQSIFHVRFVNTHCLRITLGGDYGYHIQFSSKSGVFSISTGFSHPVLDANNLDLNQWNLDDDPSICSTYESLLLECKRQDDQDGQVREVICGCGTSCGNGMYGVYKHLITHMPPTGGKSAMVKSANKV